MIKNIFQGLEKNEFGDYIYPNYDFKEEKEDVLFYDEKNKIIRILSSSNKSKDDFWYNQDEDEIVFLLQGKAILQFKNNNEYITKKTLTGGQSLKISKNILHRVEYTSENPMCIWLCVFQKD